MASPNLPAAAGNAVFQSLLRTGLLKKVMAPDSASPVLRTVEVLARVRQVGQGAHGAKGSYSIYRIAAEEQS